ncbi:uncharacterized protein LOC124401124 [Tachysurus ichikawai]
MIKSRLVPSQQTEYLGLNLDSLSYQVTLMEERIASFTQCLACFQRGQVVPYRLCLRMLGLMASVISVVYLGLLKMRDFQRQITRLRLCSRQHLSRPVRINHAFAEALRHWKSPAMLRSGIPLGAVSSRVTMTTDASLNGWGATLMGRDVNGAWPPQLMHKHINYLELLAVWLALKHFLSFLKGRHVLVKMASQENAQCPLYFSLVDANAPLGVDALAHQWPDVLLYAFPPQSLISPTLARVREQCLSLILIALRWQSRHWGFNCCRVSRGPSPHRETSCLRPVRGGI